MEIPHYHVVFCTPGDSVTAGYLDSMMKTVEWCVEEDLKFLLLNNYSSFVPSAREMTATGGDGLDWKAKGIGAGKFTYDKVFWIDSDIAWGVEDFEKLLDSDFDIVSGLYAVGDSGRVNAMRLVDGKPSAVDSMVFSLADGPIQVDGVGFGFVCMKRGVFESLPRPWFQIQQIEIEAADFPVNLSEDYSFCLKAKDAGYQIWVEPEVRVKHLKSVFLQVR